MLLRDVESFAVLNCPVHKPLVSQMNSGDMSKKVISTYRLRKFK